MPYSLEDGPAAALPDDVAAVVHCAYDLRARDRAEIERINLGGTEKLLQRSRGRPDRVHLLDVGILRHPADLRPDQDRLRGRSSPRTAGRRCDSASSTASGDGGMIGALRKVAGLPLVPMLRPDSYQYAVHAEDMARCVVASVEQAPPHRVARAWPTRAGCRSARSSGTLRAAATSKSLRSVPVTSALLYRALRQPRRSASGSGSAPTRYSGLCIPHLTSHMSTTGRSGESRCGTSRRTPHYDRHGNGAWRDRASTGDRVTSTKFQRPRRLQLQISVAGKNRGPFGTHFTSSVMAAALTLLLGRLPRQNQRIPGGSASLPNLLPPYRSRPEIWSTRNAASTKTSTSRCIHQSTTSTTRHGQAPTMPADRFLWSQIQPTSADNYDFTRDRQRDRCGAGPQPAVPFPRHVVRVLLRLHPRRHRHGGAGLAARNTGGHYRLPLHGQNVCRAELERRRLPHARSSISSLPSARVTTTMSGSNGSSFLATATGRKTTLVS